jgi:hypothetical protein
MGEMGKPCSTDGIKVKCIKRCGQTSCMKDATLKTLTSKEVSYKN